MEKIIENEVIYLRKLTSKDANHFFALNNDKEVLQYTGDVPFKELSEAEQFLRNYPNYKREGYGRWAVCLQESDAFLGWCGLSKSQESGQVDIGFRFYRKHWGKGYASMSALLCINYGFKHLELTQIVANAYKENHASIRVLEKCGLIFSKNIRYDNKAAVFYVINRVIIRVITSKETHPIRASVLRENIPLPVSFKGDDDANTFHLGAFIENELVGICSYMCPLGATKYQLRGMATSIDVQGKGLGKKLLDAGENILRERNVAVVWCNARKIALHFYEKQGFKIEGDPFEIKYIGMHFKMSKNIKML